MFKLFCLNCAKYCTNYFVLNHNEEEKKPNITLNDLARKLNVSVSTVSRALKCNPRISEQTQRKVRKLAKDMGYVSIDLLDVPKRTSNLLGIVVPEISYHLYAMAISGIESVAERHGMRIIVCQSKESYDREKSLVKELAAAGVVGVIASLASETKDFSHFLELKKAGIPLVFFNRQCKEVDADKVIIDNVRAAYEAVSHLIHVGCTKIAYLGGPQQLQINRDRAEGFKLALLENNIQLKPDYLVYSRFDRESTLSAARKLLYSSDYPDAILSFSDQMAVSVMIAAKERGISIPDQLSLIGFNNEPIDEVLEPSLTSIDQPGFKMGEESALLILKQMKETEESYENKVLKSFLVVRKSTNKNA